MNSVGMKTQDWIHAETEIGMNSVGMNSVLDAEIGMNSVGMKQIGMNSVFTTYRQHAIR